MDLNIAIVTIINVFVMPLVSVGINYRKNKENNCTTFSYTCYWALFTSVNYLFSKFFYTLICIVIKWDSLVYSYQYSVISFCFSLITPYLVDVIKNRIRIEIIIKNEK